MFDDAYEKLASEGNIHKIENLFFDAMGFLLLDACDLLPHAPHIRYIITIDSVMPSRAGDMPMLVYTFRYDPQSIGENAMIFLVKTKDSRIRLLALETHRGSYYLCEYAGYSHLNYGKIESEDLRVEIEKRLVSDAVKPAKEDPTEHNISYSASPSGYVSHRGDWGDKIIITLHSDGKRRHKKWCKNYDDNYCTALCRKCIGSAHCEHYKNDCESCSDVFHSKNDIVDKSSSPKSPSGYSWCELYRAASYGDKLLGKTVLVKNAPHTFRICEVTEEDFHFFSVEYNGKKHKYAKQTAYRNRSVYIFTGTENIRVTEDI